MKVKGYKTIIFNALLAAWGVLEATDWTSILGDSEYSGPVLMLIGLIGAALRKSTTGPIGRK